MSCIAGLPRFLRPLCLAAALLAGGSWSSAAAEEYARIIDYAGDPVVIRDAGGALLDRVAVSALPQPGETVLINDRGEVALDRNGQRVWIDSLYVDLERDVDATGCTISPAPAPSGLGSGSRYAANPGMGACR
jgi:hypothetical protein